MTRNEKLLTAALLRLASDRFSNHGCSDLGEDIENLLTKNQWNTLRKEYHEHNGDPEEYVENQILSYDWLWMSYMAHKLEQDVSNEIKGELGLND